MLPEASWFIDVIKIGGPPVIILLFAAVLVLMKEVGKRDVLIAALHKEKEDMYKEWREESANRNERVTNALNNSTLAISDHSANSEAVKTTLNAISAFMAGMAGRMSS